MDPAVAARALRRNRWKQFRDHYELYLFLLPAVAIVFIFRYIPMYGVQIAFKDFQAVRGIMGSAWAGFKYFERFFNSFQFELVLRNTIVLSLYQLAAGFPTPLVFALLLNQLRQRGYKRVVQTVTYAPHFISTVVLVGMLFLFLSPTSGLVNVVRRSLGQDPIFFMAQAGWFRHLFVISGIWQHFGWGSIIYLAALSSVDPSLHESAIIDGASRGQRIIHIDLPSVIPTAVVLLILQMGRIMDISFEKVLLMQTPLNVDTAEVIATYVYKVGLLNSQFSYAAAIGLFNSLINVVLIIVVNRIARRIGETSLW
jgi:putative aldouronate transport system permease protein